MLDELFPSASYQYVLYGMGFEPRYADWQRMRRQQMRQRADALFQKNRERAQQLGRLLPTNRDLVRAIGQRAA